MDFSGNRLNDFLIILGNHLLNHLLIFSLPALFLFIREDFPISYTEAGLLMTLLASVMAVTSVGVGTISDAKRGKRYPVIYVGLVVMVIGWISLTFVSNIQQLRLVFVLIGIGGAGFHPPALAIISEMFEKDKGKALSINMAIGMGGTAIAPLLVGLVALIVPKWQDIVMIYVTAAIIGGMVLFATTIKSGMFSRTEWEDNGDNSKNNGSLDFKFLLSPLILIPLLFISVRSSFFRTASVFTALLYEDFLHLTKSESTIATAGVLGIASMFTMVGGTISDRKTPRVAILYSAIGTFMGAAGLVFFTDFSDFFTFTLFYFILIAFYYMGSPATSALLADRVALEHRAKMFGALFSIGQALSLITPFLFGWIKDTYSLLAAFMFIFVLAIIALGLGMYIFFEEIQRAKANLGRET